MQSLEVIHADENIRVTMSGSEKASGQGTLISFTGVGHSLNGIDVQKPEFFGAGKGYDRMFFVSDLQRSWGNNIDFDLLKTLISPYTQHGPVDCLGNSMGGFLALLAPAFLKVRRSVALVPQVSVDPRIVPWERRWKEYRNAIRAWRFRSVETYLTDETEYVILVGDNRPDLKHLALLPDLENLEIFEVSGSGHRVAATLKEAGLLNSLVQRALAGEITQPWFDETIAEPFLAYLKTLDPKV